MTISFLCFLQRFQMLRILVFLYFNLFLVQFERFLFVFLLIVCDALLNVLFQCCEHVVMDFLLLCLAFQPALFVPLHLLLHCGFLYFFGALHLQAELSLGLLNPLLLSGAVSDGVDSFVLSLYHFHTRAAHTSPLSWLN